MVNVAIIAIVFSGLLLITSCNSCDLVFPCINDHDANPDSSMNNPPTNTLPTISELTFGFFTENLGQWSSPALFIAEVGFGRIWLGQESIYYVVLESCEPDTKERLTSEDMEIRTEIEQPEMRINSIRLSFEGANEVSPVGQEPLPHRNNYFHGNDSSKWFAGVNNFRRILYKNLWDGIDLIYYFNDDGIKYEYLVHPGAVVDDIRVSVTGHSSLELVKDGLLIHTHLGIPIADGGLQIYYGNMGNEDITGRFRLYDDRMYSFSVEEYDSSRPIVIDPVVYSTYIGSGGEDEGWDIAIDTNGNAYVTGDSKYSNFPYTPGAFDTVHNGDFDVVVFKMNSGGSGLIYSTYVGGNAEDSGHAIEIDTNGNAYVTGYTYSANFPNTTSAFNNSYKGYRDVFVFKLNSTGSGLLYSTHIGDNDFEYGRSLAVDSSGNAYVTGYTWSTGFPVTMGAFNTSNSGKADVFILKLNPSGSEIVYSTLIGGAAEEFCRAIEIDSNGYAYVTGVTYSNDFPITDSAYNTLFSGSVDAFILKLDPTGSSLIYSTYVGGIEEEYSRDIEVDPNGNVYVTGYTLSSNYPTTIDAYDSTYNGQEDVFILKLNPAGSKLLYSTYIGGAHDDRSRDVAVTSDGCAYITGETFSFDFPNAEQNNNISKNYSDVFLLKLDSSGSELLYSTSFGGTNMDFGTDVELDSLGNTYLTGLTYSSDFPVTSNSYDSFFSGEIDIFVLKFNFTILPTAPVNFESLISNQSVYLTWDKPLFPGSSYILGYNIYRGNTSGALSLLTTIGTELSYNDTNVINTHTYFYRVSSFNSLGEGELSRELNATPLPIPAPPLNVRAISRDGYVHLSWEPPVSDGGSKILKYNIYRAHTPGNLTFFAEVSRTTLSYNDTSVINGKTYFYQLTAENMLSESNPSKTLNITPKGPPYPPENFMAIPGNGFVYLTWKPPISNGGYNVTTYKLFKSNHSGGEFYIIYIDTNFTYFNDTQVTNGNTYYYYLRALNRLGESNRTTEINITPVGFSEPPIRLNGTAGFGYINLSWQAPLNDGGGTLTGYKIYKMVFDSEYDSGYSDLYTFIVDIAKNTFHDTDVSSQNYYRYRVTALNSYGESEPTDIVGLSPYGLPGPPGQIMLTPDYGLLELAWESPEYDGGLPISRYIIYRGINIYNYDPLDSVSPWVTSYRDPTVASEQKYYYYITAVTDIGESEESKVVSGIPLTVLLKPSPPQAFQASASDRLVNLSWATPSDDGGSHILGYKIFRGTKQGSEVQIVFVSSYYNSYHDLKVVNGFTYYYYIKAVNDVGDSDPSDSVSATPMGEEKDSNGPDPGSDNLTLVVIWLLMILITIVIIFTLARKRAFEQRRKQKYNEQEQSFDSEWSDHLMLDETEYEAPEPSEVDKK